MTIISASYRTDIPAFYGPWFGARLDAGEARTVNPWNGRIQAISLAPDDVDGFVFWTRNPAPFAPHLERVAASWPFVVQLTVTGYPRALDRSVVPVETAVALARELADRYGPRRLVWRYDPIVLSSLTPPGWHLENFARLTNALGRVVDEVVVSVMQVYRKTRRNMDRAAAAHGFCWWDPATEEKRTLLADLAPIARAAGLRMTLCAQPDLLVEGIAPATCIDPARLFGPGHAHRYPRSQNRPGCLCARAKDIGRYETCPHGCVYCYAVGDPRRAKANYDAHDHAGDSLID